MRVSVWLLFVATTLLALFWLCLVIASRFSIWTVDSNAAGLILQIGLMLFPIALFFGLKQSQHSLRRTAALFIFGWAIPLSALLLLTVL
jgi:hypothetical protein